MRDAPPGWPASATEGRRRFFAGWSSVVARPRLPSRRSESVPQSANGRWPSRGCLLLRAKTPALAHPKATRRKIDLFRRKNREIRYHPPRKDPPPAALGRPDRFTALRNWPALPFGPGGKPAKGQPVPSFFGEGGQLKPVSDPSPQKSGFPNELCGKPIASQKLINRRL